MKRSGDFEDEPSYKRQDTSDGPAEFRTPKYSRPRPPQFDRRPRYSARVEPQEASPAERLSQLIILIGADSEKTVKQQCIELAKCLIEEYTNHSSTLASCLSQCVGSFPHKHFIYAQLFFVLMKLEAKPTVLDFLRKIVSDLDERRFSHDLLQSLYLRNQLVFLCLLNQCGFLTKDSLEKVTAYEQVTYEDHLPTKNTINELALECEEFSKLQLPERMSQLTIPQVPYNTTEAYIMSVVCFVSHHHRIAAQHIHKMFLATDHDVHIEQVVSVVTGLLFEKQLPFPDIYLSVLLADLVALDPVAYSRVLGKVCHEKLFREGGLLGRGATWFHQSRFLRWFSHYLNQFEFKWNWEFLVNHPELNNDVFKELLQKMIRLSYEDRIRKLFSDYPQVQEMIPRKITLPTDESLKQAIKNRALVLDGQKEDIWVALLDVGNKSSSHTYALMERYKDQLKLDSRLLELTAVYWNHQPQMMELVLQKATALGNVDLSVLITYLLKESSWSSYRTLLSIGSSNNITLMKDIYTIILKHYLKDPMPVLSDWIEELTIVYSDVFHATFLSSVLDIREDEEFEEFKDTLDALVEKLKANQ